MPLHLLAAVLLPLVQAPGAQIPDATFPGEAYRALFDRGVVALEAGQSERAVALFRAAGERAPDGRVWQRYLDVAEGLDPRPWKVSERVDPPWASARTIARWGPALDPTGERLLAGGREAHLIDVRTGAIIARLESRLPSDRRAWVFDDTGTVIVGTAGDMSRSPKPLGVDVRDARSGRPLELAGAARLVLRTGAGSRFEWFPAGTPPPATPRGAEDLDGPEGVLRVHRIEEANGLIRVMSPDRTRALIWSNTSPSTVRLIDRTTGEEITRISPAHWPAFSSDGALFMARSTDVMRVFDAVGGTDLGSYEHRLGTGAESTQYAFRGADLVRLDSDGTLTVIDVATRRTSPLCRLDPAPGHLWGGLWFIRGGTLAIAFSFEWTSCYDVRTGAQLWRSEGGGSGVTRVGLGRVNAAETMVTTHDADRLPIVLDARTGERAWGSAARAIRTVSVHVLAGEQAVIVAASDGTLCRVELETGATLAWTDEHAATSAAAVRRLAGGDILTTGADGHVAVRDPKTLVARASVEIGGGGLIVSASADGGRVVALRQRWSSEYEIVSLTGDLSGARFPAPATTGEARWGSAAVSPDGSRAVFVHRGRVAVVDAATGEIEHDHALFGDRDVGHADFLDDDRVLVGWTGDMMVGDYSGVAVVSVEGGEVLATLDTPAEFFCTGAVLQTRHLADVGLLVYSVSPSGFVRAYRTDDWTHAWTMPYSGGNWDTLHIGHEPGGERLTIWGMSPSHARIADVGTGRVHAEREVHGEFWLGLTHEERYLVGERDGALVVSNGKTLELLYVRHEAAGGTAWITRDGRRRPAAGGLTNRDDPSHLIRDGWSAPVDCWDAWLVDPRGIAPFELAELPNPPVVLSGPPRNLAAKEDGAELELRVRSARALIGVEVTAPGEAPRFVPLELPEPNESGVTAVAWKENARGDLVLRAVSRRGLLSRPWRVMLR